MSTDVSTWLRVFFVLQASAMESRGFIEVSSDTDDAARWPRTSGHDVIAIAAVLDPYLRKMPSDFGAHAMARRWLAIVEDLERFALVDPRAEYAENRSFWRALPAVCVYLHASGAPLPSAAVWDALHDVLADSSALRNVGSDSPFQSFDVKTWDDLFSAQRRHLGASRGEDELAPEPGMTGGKTRVPRTTNADVIALADYWSKKLADVREVFGHQGAVARWKRALGDVATIARKGDPNAVYLKNHGFWRDLQSTAIHIAAADETPSKGEQLIDSIKTSVRELPENLAGGAKKVASALGEAAGDVAHGVGKIANEAGKGLFSGFGGPLLIGAGLLGVFLISRNRASAEKVP